MKLINSESASKIILGDVFSYNKIKYNLSYEVFNVVFFAAFKTQVLIKYNP